MYCVIRKNGAILLERRVVAGNVNRETLLFKKRNRLKVLI
jgi:hypothetical protein